MFEMLTPPTWDRTWLTLRNTLLPNMCYHSKFRRSRSNRLGVGKGANKIGDAAGAPPRGIGRG